MIFILDENNNVLIGTSEGLYIRTAEDRSLRHLPVTYKNEKLAVTKFFRNGDGVLYIGTQVSVFKLNRDFSIEALPNTEKDVVMKRIIESRVVSMTADTIEGHPVLLVSPYGHYLAYYDFVLQQWVSRQDSTRQIIKKFNIKDNLIRKFFKAANGKIWMATSKAGLGEWVKNSSPVVHYYSNVPGNDSSISNNHIFDIREDIKGNLWVSTYGGGLHHFNVATKKFQHITASHNLAEGMQVDDNGNIWMIATATCTNMIRITSPTVLFNCPILKKQAE